MILRKSLHWIPILVASGGLYAQTCIALSRPTVAANGTASLELTLLTPRDSALVGIQWSFQYPASSIATLSVEEGPALTTAGKTLICTGNAGARNCLTLGVNTNAIRSGVIARLTAVLASGAKMPAIVIKSPVGASAEGYLIPVLSKGASDTGTVDCAPPPEKKSQGGK